MKATEAELEILKVLWELGSATVKEVHQILAEKKDAVYTTTLKQMQVMHEKGLLERKVSGKAHIYTPTPDRTEAQGQILQRVIDNVFNGSAMQMVMQALGNYMPNKEELDMIETYLEKKRKQKRK